MLPAKPCLPTSAPCPPVGPVTGARYQIVVDGQPRSNRDDRAIAIEAAEYLKYKHPHAEVTVHDLMTGDTITIKTPGRAP